MSQLTLPTLANGSVSIVAPNKETLELIRSIYYFSSYNSNIVFLPETGMHPYDQTQKGLAFRDAENVIILTLSPFIITTFAYSMVYAAYFDPESATLLVKPFSAHPQSASWEKVRNVGEFWSQVREKWALTLR